LFRVGHKTLTQSINHSINRSIDRSIDRSTDQSVNYDVWWWMVWRWSMPAAEADVRWWPGAVHWTSWLRLLQRQWAVIHHRGHVSGCRTFRSVHFTCIAAITCINVVAG